MAAAAMVDATPVDGVRSPLPRCGSGGGGGERLAARVESNKCCVLPDMVEALPVSPCCRSLRSLVARWMQDGADQQPKKPIAALALAMAPEPAPATREACSAAARLLGGPALG